MLVFPQLVTGSIAQYPFRRRRLRRTIVNELRDGTTIKAHDPGASVFEFAGDLRELTDTEREQLENLFAETEGRLRPFVFIDPEDNLLEQSGALTTTVWNAAPGIGLTGGAADPVGSNTAWQAVNSGAAPGSIEQSIATPGWFQYCFSLWVRSSSPVTVELYRETASSSGSAVVTAANEWKRFATSGKLENTDELIRFGLRIPAGAQATIFGPQVDAQWNPSPYRKTTTRNGLHSRAFFADPELHITATGPNRNAARVRIHARE